MKSIKPLSLIFIIISLLGYIFLYYGIDRTEFFSLIISVFILGLIYFYWLKNKSLTVKMILVIGVLFRVVLLFDTPNFSDDFYRFAWDGKLQTQGINPYLQTPTQLVAESTDFKVEETHDLYLNLNSKEYFTVYPPVNQSFFALAELASNGSIYQTVIWMKVIILLFEIGLFYILFLILKRLKLPETLSQIYFLNPLVIIELTGNVHFEGVMLFFLMLGLLMVLRNKIWLTGIALGLAVSVKLIPLLILPLFLPLLGWKKSTKLYVALGITFILTLLPFITTELIDNFSQSVNLYFQTFEFNASVYYLLKDISYITIGYKSSLLGMLIPLFVFCFAMYLVIKLYKESKVGEVPFKLFIQKAAVLLFIYYMLATTVHPWYVINLVVLSVFLNSRVYLLWSLTVFLSYFAYSSYILNFAPDQDFHQYNWYYFIIALEYLALVFFVIFERRKSNQNLKINL